MASLPRPSSTPLASPRDPAAIERTFSGFRAALAQMSIPELIELSTRQAAALEAETRSTLLGTLSGYLERNLDSPVLRSTPTALLPPDPRRGLDDRPSPSRLPSRLDRPSTSAPRGRRIVANLVRSGMAANARRERREGRR